MAKITIFGLAGTGTSTAGKMLAQEFAYRYVSSGGMLRDKAKRLGLTLEELQLKITEDPSEDKALDDEIVEFGKQNNDFVIESRLAWFFIPDSVKIKLTCEFTERIRRVANRDGISFAEAEEKTVLREKIDAERWKRFYGIDDISEDQHFDLVIDSTKTVPGEVAQKIKDFLHSRNG